MRDRRGEPNLRVRAVALAVVLGLLGAPVVVVLLSALSRVLRGLV